MVTYVVGHKVPDTDSVCASIALAHLKKELGEDTVAIMQGPLNPETEFVLGQFDVEAPEIVTDAAGKDIYFVDHSDLSQSMDNLKDANVLGIVDHHKLGDFTTSKPLEIWAWPVGCSCTVINGMYEFHNIEVPQKIAGLMLSAILSDTVIFKSATCTEKDILAAKKLAAIADVENLEDFGMDLFKAKSAVDGVPADKLLMRDFKVLEMHGKKVGIGQLEVVDIFLLDEVKPELAKALESKKAEGFHTVMLLLTDIMKEGSEVLIMSDDEELTEKAFDKELVEGKIWLPGVMSRKKQIVPQVDKALSE